MLFLSLTNTMYSSNSVDFRKESPSPPPTAPPYPHPPPVPLAFPEPTTDQVDERNQTNSSDSTAPNSNSLGPIPWSTGLCDCCDDVSTCTYGSMLFFGFFKLVTRYNIA